MSLANTFFSCEKAYMETVERLENEMDTLWNMSSSNKLPQELTSFEADRDPIEVLSQDLIARELHVEVGFVNLIRPISKWWEKMGKAPSVATKEEVPAKSSDKENEAA